jgi:hypothetical protein
LTVLWDKLSESNTRNSILEREKNKLLALMADRNVKVKPIGDLDNSGLPIASTTIRTNSHERVPSTEAGAQYTETAVEHEQAVTDTRGERAAHPSVGRRGGVAPPCAGRRSGRRGGAAPHNWKLSKTDLETDIVELKEKVCSARVMINMLENELESTRTKAINCKAEQTRSIKQLTSYAADDKSKYAILEEQFAEFRDKSKAHKLDQVKTQKQLKANIEKLKSNAALNYASLQHVQEQCELLMKRKASLVRELTITENEKDCKIKIIHELNKKVNVFEEHCAELASASPVTLYSRLRSLISDFWAKPRTLTLIEVNQAFGMLVFKDYTAGMKWSVACPFGDHRAIWEDIHRASIDRIKAIDQLLRLEPTTTTDALQLPAPPTSEYPAGPVYLATGLEAMFNAATDAVLDRLHRLQPAILENVIRCFPAEEWLTSLREVHHLLKSLIPPGRLETATELLGDFKRAICLVDECAKQVDQTITWTRSMLDAKLSATTMPSQVHRPKARTLKSRDIPAGLAEFVARHNKRLEQLTIMTSTVQQCGTVTGPTSLVGLYTACATELGMRALIIAKAVATMPRCKCGCSSADFATELNALKRMDSAEAAEIEKSEQQYRALLAEASATTKPAAIRFQALRALHTLNSTRGCHACAHEVDSVLCSIATMCSTTAYNGNLAPLQQLHAECQAAGLTPPPTFLMKSSVVEASRLLGCLEECETERLREAIRLLTADLSEENFALLTFANKLAAQLATLDWMADFDNCLKSGDTNAAVRVIEVFVSNTALKASPAYDAAKRKLDLALTSTLPNIVHRQVFHAATESNVERRSTVLGSIQTVAKQLMAWLRPGSTTESARKAYEHDQENVAITLAVLETSVHQGRIEGNDVHLTFAITPELALFGGVLKGAQYGMLEDVELAANQVSLAPATPTTVELERRGLHSRSDGAIGVDGPWQRGCLFLHIAVTGAAKAAVGDGDVAACFDTSTSTSRRGGVIKLIESKTSKQKTTKAAASTIRAPAASNPAMRNGRGETAVAMGGGGAAVSAVQPTSAAVAVTKDAKVAVGLQALRQLCDFVPRGIIKAELRASLGVGDVTDTNLATTFKKLTKRVAARLDCEFAHTDKGGDTQKNQFALNTAAEYLFGESKSTAGYDTLCASLPPQAPSRSSGSPHHGNGESAIGVAGVERKFRLGTADPYREDVAELVKFYIDEGDHLRVEAPTRDSVTLESIVYDGAAAISEPAISAQLLAPAREVLCEAIRRSDRKVTLPGAGGPSANPAHPWRRDVVVEIKPCVREAACANGRTCSLVRMAKRWDLEMEHSLTSYEACSGSASIVLQHPDGNTYRLNLTCDAEVGYFSRTDENDGMHVFSVDGLGAWANKQVGNGRGKLFVRAKSPLSR